jgi:signal transduction histidine kinase
MLQKKSMSQTNKMLKEIKDNAVNLMEKMDDIVWSINPKNDTLENLMLRIKHFAAQLFEAKNIDYNINISEAIAQLKISMDKRQHLYLIIKESINNIIKHAGCSYVNITASQQHNELVITIEDNGIGFNTADTFSGNGLLSLQNRARLMHARLNIKSAFEKGTIITVHIKIK